MMLWKRLLWFTLLSFFICIGVNAQEPTSPKPRSFAYEPLRPASTDSPRSTLLSFLNDYQIVLDELVESRKVTNDYSLAAYDRAVNTLNFQNTPDGGSRWVQTEMLALLKEVLDKVPLPDISEIPDAQQVKEEGLTEWSIPNTKIVLSITRHGPYAGEWQFSPRTVQMLPRFYRQLKDTPYQPGASENIYQMFISNQQGLINRERRLGNRLRAVNTNSPRATLEGFLKNMNQAYEYAMKVNDALESDPQTMTTEEAEAIGNLAEDNIARAIATLNLSEVPEALRYDSGIEAAMQIKEVLDRLAPAPLDQIPDLQMVREIRAESNDPNRPIRWIYPNTGIEILEIMEGHEAGTFKFSPEQWPKPKSITTRSKTCLTGIISTNTSRQSMNPLAPRRGSTNSTPPLPGV